MGSIEYLRGAINAGDCVGQAWELVKRNLGMYVAMGIVTLLMISCIPIVNFFLLGPMMGGFAYVVLRDMRDEPIDFGMLFKGFEKFVPLMVLGIIQAVPAIIFQIIQYTVDFGSGLAGGSGTGGAPIDGGAGISAIQAALMGSMFVFFLIYFVFQMIWNALLIFAIPLVVERDVPLGEAITTGLGAVFSNIGGLIVLVILNGLVGLLGFLALCIGMFVAIPVTYAANVIAYRMVFPYFEPTNVNTAPPPPDVYGNFGRT